MERGIVGGSLLDQRAEMEAVSALALRVLHGEAADDIPIAVPDLHVRQVDWRQLQRWGIADARVPAGTLVRFKEPDAWERYRSYAVGAMAILLTQTALIAGLAIQALRRRQAEARARSNQAELRASFDRIRDLGARLLNAQEAERSRIARELHDDISQQIALMAIDIESVRELDDSRSSEAAKRGCEALNRLEGISRSVHDLSHRLHPAKLGLVGLVAALAGLRRELSRPDLAIEFTHDRVPTALPQELTLCLFRIGQEALGNAVKHSGAREVFVHLYRYRDRLVLTIADNGRGFDVKTAWGRGLGLISMRERLDAIGGTLEVHSTRGDGTHLEVSVPILHGLQTGSSALSSETGA
jgi:signal transduction histidine kinase